MNKIEDFSFTYKIDIEFELSLHDNKDFFVSEMNERVKVLLSNIDACEKIKKAAKTQSQKDYIEIWNCLGFINIIALDLVSVGKALILENEKWQKIYFARQVVLLIYEALNDIPEILGKEYKKIFILINESKDYMEQLNLYKKELEKIKKENYSYLHEIRTNVAAHRDQNIDSQIKVLREIDPYKIIKILFAFEKSLRKISDHLQMLAVRTVKI